MRQNHKLERDLAKLDKRIALLIKNRTNLQDVIAASKGLKSQSKKEIFQMEPKKLEVHTATTPIKIITRLIIIHSAIKIYFTCYKPNLVTWLDVSI